MLWLRRLVGIAFFVAVLVFGWTFAKRNAEPVHLDYLIGTLDEPGWLIVGIAAALGAAATAIAMGFQLARLALTARRYRKLASGLEDEVHQLRNLPLAAPDGPTARGVAARSPESGGIGRSAT
jgi:uncharacterized integral membrane protein